MNVRLYRPRDQRRARVLLALAVLLPAAGILQVSGINPLSLSLAAISLIAAVWIAADTVRPTATATRYGILIRGPIGRPPDAVSWTEVVRVEELPGLVCLTTRGKVQHQIRTGTRTAEFIGRMIRHHVTAL